MSSIQIASFYGSVFVLSAVLVLAPHWPPWGRRQDQSPAAVDVLRAPHAIAAIVIVLGIYLAVYFGLFYEENWSEIAPDSLRLDAVWHLLGYHTVLLMLCVGQAGLMTGRLWLRNLRRAGICGLVGLCTLATAGTTFLMGFPRGGGEGAMLWFAFMLAFLAVACVHVSLSVVFFGIGIHRMMHQPTGDTAGAATRG